MNYASSNPEHWNFSCPDWIERLAAGKSLMPDLPLNALEAARGIAIFNKLRLPDVEGMPSLAEAGGDWFREVVGAVIGSVDETGRRWVRDVFILVPKKNSKTTNGAALMLTAVLADPSPNQTFYLYGPTQEIAHRGFSQAEGMIHADDVLRNRFSVQPHLKTIRDLKTGTVLKVQTFDEKVATGAIPKGQLIDEMHVLGKAAAAERILGQLRGNMLARPDAFMVKITTQSDEPPAGAFKSDLKLAREIRDGEVTGAAARMLPILYEFPKHIQQDAGRLWENVDLWHRVLPNLGKSLRLDVLEADYQTSKAKGEQEIRRWISQHLNWQIGMSLTGDPWVGAQYWEGAGDDRLTLDELLARSEVVVAGIDGGGLDDLVGMALIGRDRDTQEWLHWAHAWAHDDVWARRPQIASVLDDFIGLGQLTRCTEPDQEIRDIADLLERVNGLGLFPADYAIGFDRAGVAAMVDEVRARGISEEQTVWVAQGYQLTTPIWGLERKLKNGSFVHGAQALMAWSVGNARVERRGSNDIISKEVSGKSKIDPVIATLNAFTLMSRGPEAVTTKSVYEERGVLVL